jgi:outer membrane lipoprotein-sorting protein
MSSAKPLSSVVIEEGNTVWLYGPDTAGKAGVVQMSLHSLKKLLV